ncbi:hypothetical protein IV54_GL000915 [Levilactobacillus paucivorans]|uniref:DUF4097 domain-containing protein n=1 Tax=Levilactobacillus paucivorans TaxID=616990 RepID=A0A0R2LZ61_9LACO|nr:DUF4097 family beta strand repeat-containing protein [Levilactobacillus paucivorans]KRO04738.1 hypothetical protein IV54_GL000915 [Levilactobacillus paucivorans]
MKKSLKISLILMVLGAILLGIGWKNHGDKSVVWDHSSRGLKTLEHAKTSTNPGNYQRITIDSPASVTVKSGNTSRVTVSYVNHAQSTPKVKVAKGTLAITDGGSSDVSSITVFGKDHTFDKGGVLVTVPRGKQLKDITVKQGSGSISLRGLTADNVKVANADDVSMMDLRVKNGVSVDSSNGDVWASQLRAKRLSVVTIDGDTGISSSHLTGKDNRLDSGSGDIRLSETTLGGGRISTDDGDVHLQDNHLKGQLKTETGDGDIRATVPTSAGLKVTNADDDMGDITIWGRSRHSGFRLAPKAAAQYVLHAEDGDITVGKQGSASAD